MRNDKRDLQSIQIAELEKLAKPWELAILLKEESLSSKTDIMMENMLDYYVQQEMYDYAIVIRDEINSRKLIQKKTTKVYSSFS